MSNLSIDPFMVPGGMTDIIDERGQMFARCRDRETAERIIAAFEALEKAQAFARRVQHDACEKQYCSGGCLAQAAGDLLDTLRAGLAPAQEAASDGE